MFIFEDFFPLPLVGFPASGSYDACSFVRVPAGFFLISVTFRTDSSPVVVPKVQSVFPRVASPRPPGTERLLVAASRKTGSYGPLEESLAFWIRHVIFKFRVPCVWPRTKPGRFSLFYFPFLMFCEISICFFSDAAVPPPPKGVSFFKVSR